MLEILFPSLKVEKIYKSFLIPQLPQTPELYLGQTKLVPQHLTLLRFLPICNTFPIIGQCSFFYFCNKPWYSDESAWGYVTFLVWAAWDFFKWKWNWKCLLHILSWRNLVNKKNSKKCMFQLGNLKYKKNKEQKLLTRDS